MTNHVHLLLTPNQEQSISKTLQILGRYYVQYYNHCYQRTGALWEERYKATRIDSASYLLTCMRYIELNSVRTGMVAHPVEYPWSTTQVTRKESVMSCLMHMLSILVWVKPIQTVWQRTATYFITIYPNAVSATFGKQPIRHGY